MYSNNLCEEITMKDKLIVSAFIVCLTIAASGCATKKTMLLRTECTEMCVEIKSGKMWKKEVLF